ncbi:hypothetical protein [Streptomyces sp. NPDC059256]
MTTILTTTYRMGLYRDDWGTLSADAKTHTVTPTAPVLIPTVVT